MTRRGIFGSLLALAGIPQFKIGPRVIKKREDPNMAVGLPDYTNTTVYTPANRGTFQPLDGMPGVTTAFVTWPTANLAIYIPITLDNAQDLYGFGAIIGGVGGNLDIGLFDPGNNLLISLGGVAFGASAGSVKLFAGGAYAVGPGVYHIVVSSDSNVISVLSAQLQPGLNSLCQGVEGPSGYPLASHIMASFSTTRNMVPLICGVWGVKGA